MRATIRQSYLCPDVGNQLLLFRRYSSFPTFLFQGRRPTVAARFLICLRLAEDLFNSFISGQFTPASLARVMVRSKNEVFGANRGGPAGVPRRQSASSNRALLAAPPSQRVGDLICGVGRVLRCEVPGEEPRDARTGECNSRDSPKHDPRAYGRNRWRAPPTKYKDAPIRKGKTPR